MKRLIPLSIRFLACAALLPATLLLSATYAQEPFLKAGAAEPVGENLALNKTATQSSTYESRFSELGNAGLAVDGNTRGDYYTERSVSHTDRQVMPWWSVDLGAEDDLGSLVIYNRTDGYCAPSNNCAERLHDVTVLVAAEGDRDFAHPQEFKTPGVLSAEVYHGAFPAGTTGRYVRIRIEGEGILSLAEVEIYGPPQVVELDEEIAEEDLKISPERLERRRRVKMDVAGLLAGLPERIDEEAVPLTLRLFEDAEYEVVLEGAESGPDQERIYHGRVAGMPYSEVVLVGRTATQRLHGFLRTETSYYEIQPESDGLHHVYEVNLASFGHDEPEHDSGVAAAVPASLFAAASLSADVSASGENVCTRTGRHEDPTCTAKDKDTGPYFASIAVLYTEAYLKNKGDHENVRLAVKAAITQANEVYELSQVHSRQVEVLIAHTTYKEATKKNDLGEENGAANVKADLDAIPSCRGELRGQGRQRGLHGFRRRARGFQDRPGRDVHRWSLW